MDYFKYTFNEDEWCIYLIEDDDFDLLDEGSEGSTSFFKREVYVRKSKLNLAIILHELWHVYFSYCYLDDTTEMKLGDIEEVSAALFSDKGSKIIERGTEIYNKLLELKDKNNND